MKPCDKFLLYMQEEDLTAQQKAQLSRHLQECAACRAEKQFWELQQEALQAPAAPEAVVEALFSQTTRRRKSIWLAFKPAFASLAVLLIGVGLFTGGWVWKGHPGYDSREVMAYMTDNLDEEYQNFALDLAQLEADF